jgi:glycine/D-amino acid oxidase-like deaminating enzyme
MAGRVIIAGGGVIGCSIAYYLSKAGAEVVLLERGEVGGEASGAAAAGMLIAPLRMRRRGIFGRSRPRAWKCTRLHRRDRVAVRNRSRASRLRHRETARTEAREGFEGDDAPAE